MKHYYALKKMTSFWTSFYITWPNNDILSGGSTEYFKEPIYIS